MINKLRQVNLITPTGRINPNKHKILEKNPVLEQEIYAKTSHLVGDNITLSERLFVLLQDIKVQPTCKNCGIPVRFIPDKKKFQDFCSVKCSRNNPEVKNKTKRTIEERYGADRKPIKQKIQHTKRCQTDEQKKEYRQKRIDTCLRKYGVTDPNIISNIPELNDKRILEAMNSDHTLTEMANMLGVDQSTLTRRFQNYNLTPTTFAQSTHEKQLVDFIRDVAKNETIICNDRTLIHPKELDVVLPNRKIAIELNGNVWHSEGIGNRSRQYHNQKTKMCAQHNIKLIHIYESEWLLQQPIVKSRISSFLGKCNRIYARKCQIKNLSTDEYRTFVNRTHIQGYCPATIKLGLYYNHQLVAAMSFGKSRFSRNKYQYELLRFSSELNTRVIGGGSKLFSHFIKTYDPESVVSYSDRRWGTGDLYEQLGFDFSHTSNPNYKYFKKSEPLILISRQKFQKHKLPKILKNFDSNQTEWKNMQSNGYDRIWDCGNDVWIWTAQNKTSLK